MDSSVHAVWLIFEPKEKDKSDEARPEETHIFFSAEYKQAVDLQAVQVSGGGSSHGGSDEEEPLGSVTRSEGFRLQTSPVLAAYSSSGASSPSSTAAVDVEGIPVEQRSPRKRRKSAYFHDSGSDSEHDNEEEVLVKPSSPLYSSLSEPDSPAAGSNDGTAYKRQPVKKRPRLMPSSSESPSPVQFLPLEKSPTPDESSGSGFVLATGMDSGKN